MVTEVQSIGSFSSVAPVGAAELKDAAQVAAINVLEKQPKQSFSKEQMDAVVLELNKAMQIMNTSLSFSIDQATKQTVVKVTDVNTKQVIRQIPSEEMLRVSQRIAELLGVLFDHAG
jgi:flagellar protein FlaG